MDRITQFLDLAVDSYDLKVICENSIRDQVPIVNDHDYFAKERYELELLLLATRSLTGDDSVRLDLSCTNAIDNKSSYSFNISYEITVDGDGRLQIRQIGGEYKWTDFVDELMLALTSAVY